jgi:hypothetical protein
LIGRQYFSWVNLAGHDFAGTIFAAANLTATYEEWLMPFGRFVDAVEQIGHGFLDEAANADCLPCQTSRLELAR